MYFQSKCEHFYYTKLDKLNYLYIIDLIICHSRVMEESSNIHEIFLEQTKTSKDREEMSLKLKKTPGEINSLAAYHDFMRLKNINKHLAKIYIVAGIRWVWELKKLNAKQVDKKIKESRIGSEVAVAIETINASISEAKNTPLLLQGLEKEDFFLQRKWYIFSKTPDLNQDIKEEVKNNTDISLFILMLIILAIFSFISIYFIALVPILLSVHIIFGSRIGKWIIYPIMQLISNGWILIISAGLLSISACVFAIWFLSWDIHSNIINIFKTSSYTDNSQSFFPDEIYSHYEDRDITREELVKILSVSKEIDLNNWQEIDCFKDSFQSKFPKELCYAKDSGYIQGDNEWNFNPTQTVSHAAGLKFILNFYWYRVPKESLYITFTDLQKRQWQTTYAEYAKRIWIIPTSNKEFHPEKTITIDQVDWYLQALSSK